MSGQHRESQRQIPMNTGERTMSKNFEEIINAVKEFSLEERARLANILLISLDESSEAEIDRLWLQEAECRLKAFREGKVTSRPAEDVFNEAIADIS